MCLLKQGFLNNLHRSHICAVLERILNFNAPTYIYTHAYIIIMHMHISYVKIAMMASYAAMCITIYVLKNCKDQQVLMFYHLKIRRCMYTVHL